MPAPKAINDNREKREAWHREQRGNSSPLRHSRATRIEKQEGVERVSVDLGHCRINTTGFYVERDLERTKNLTMKQG